MHDELRAIEPVDVYMLGTVFSGSTLVGNALGTHPDAFFAGEIAALPAYAERYRVMDAIDGCLACALLGKPCEIWTHARKARVSAVGPAHALSELRADTGRSVMIDGSKLMAWFRVVLADGGISPERTRVVVTSKDPFSFADSFMRRMKVPAWQAANVWRDSYVDVFRSLSAARLLHTHVSYAEMSADPEGAIKRVCRLAGLPFFLGLLDFRSVQVCSIGGNPGAHVNREGMLSALSNKKDYVEAVEARHWQAYRDRGGDRRFVDLKWTERLTPGDVSQILQTPGLADLAALLGYDLAHLIGLAKHG